MVHVLPKSVLWENIGKHGVVVLLVDGSSTLIGVLIFSKVFISGTILPYLPVGASIFSYRCT